MKTLSRLGLLVLVGTLGCNRAAPPPPPPAAPKAETQPMELPPGHPPIGGDMRGQSLPADVVAQDSTPQWTPPADWKSVPASTMRKATFQIDNAAGQAEVAISAFPGDVGGALMNVNRWRGQIGLGPVTAEEVGALTTPLDLPAGKATVVDFASDKQRMVVVTLPHAGSSWFFKLTGATSVVAAEKEKFVEFVKSVKF